MLTHGLVEVLDELSHISTGDSFPSLLNNYHFALVLQATHLVDEALHNDDGHHWEEDLVVLDSVNLKDHEPLAEQVDVVC